MSTNPTEPAPLAHGANARPEMQRYSGYYANHIPKYDLESMETGPGTPVGKYTRRFWRPVCMSIELTDMPRFLKILGEELVASRDGSGRVGVLHAY